MHRANCDKIVVITTVDKAIHYWRHSPRYVLGCRFAQQLVGFYGLSSLLCCYLKPQVTCMTLWTEQTTSTQYNTQFIRLGYLSVLLSSQAHHTWSIISRTQAITVNKHIYLSVGRYGSFLFTNNAKSIFVAITSFINYYAHKWQLYQYLMTMYCTKH